MACQAGKDFLMFFLGITCSHGPRGHRMFRSCLCFLDPVADDAALADALANDEPAVDLEEDERVLSGFSGGHSGDV